MDSFKNLKLIKPLKSLSRIARGTAIVGFGLLPAAAMALSVGPIRVMSNLNQSLIANIPLSHFNDLDETQIKISVAENIYFTKAGVQKSTWLNDLKFNIVKNPDDTGFIELRTKNPVKDPVVDVLINISWPSGKMIRQYTVFLDPSDVSHTPIANPRTYSSPNIKSKPYAQTSVKNSDTPPSQIGFGHRYGPIKADDSLWQIAHKMVANSPYTAAQGVLAIYEKNVGAFYQNNMNKLKEGAVLYLPESFEVAQITAREAGDKIAASPQIAASYAQKVFEQDNNTGTTVAMQTLRDSKPLKILSPTDLNESVKKKSSDFSPLEELSAEKTQAIQQKLALLEEALDTAQRKNEQIQAQNNILEDNHKRLVDAIHNQNKVLMNQQDKIETQKSDSSAVATAPDIKMEPKVGHSTAAVKSDTVDSATEQLNKRAAVAPTKPAPPPIAPININNNNSTSQTGSWILYFLAFLGVVGVGGYWFWRKRQLNMANHHAKDAYASDESKIEKNKADANRIVNYGLDFDMDEALSAMVLPEDNEVVIDHSANEQLNAKFDYEGVKQKFQKDLEEAELMIAYEKYDDAEKVLSSILTKAPNHWLALLRLLELYVVTQNHEKFYHWQQTITDEMKHIAPDTWSKVKFLNEKLAQDRLVESELPNNAEFEEDIEHQKNNEQEANEDEPEKPPLEFIIENNKALESGESEELEKSEESELEHGLESMQEQEYDLEQEQEVEHILDLNSAADSILKDSTGQEQTIDLEQKLSDLKNLAALIESNSSIELAKAFVLAGENKSAKHLLKHLLEQTSEADEKLVIEQLLVEID